MENMLDRRLQLEIHRQPDDTTCGPTALQAVYRFYGDEISLEQVIDEVRQLEGGGTLEVFLACHALRRGYRARIYTYNLHVFDPTWFGPVPKDLRVKLEAQMRAKDNPKLHTATRGYLEFLDLGGELRFEDLTIGLIRKYLNRSVPLLAGLSATYLHRSERELGSKNVEDDIRGVPVGHFVVLCGYDPARRVVMVADPNRFNPHSPEPYYLVGIERVLCAILLAVITYDANILVIEPARKRRGSHHEKPGRRQ